MFIAAAVVFYAGAIYFQDVLGAVTVAIAIAGAIAFAGAFAVAGAVSYLHKAKGPRTHHLLIFIAVQLIYITAVIYFVPDLQSKAGRAIPLIIFLAIFPLFNAIADFLSIGLTRYSLRKGLKDFTFKWVVVDLVGGIMIFIGLAGLLISYFHFIRPQDHLALLDIPNFLTDLRDHPQNYWWLALMTLSTLLPTFIHGGIGVLTVAIQAPTGLREYVKRNLKTGHKGSPQAGFWAGAVICAMITVAWWVPIALAYELFSLNHGWVIDNTIGAFQTYSNWLAQTFPI